MVEEKQTKKPDFYSGTGRRKRAVARVWLYNRKGEVTVNEKPIETFFTDIPNADKIYLRPFQVTMMTGKVSASIKVAGGGRNGQLGAVTLGLARALLELDESYRSVLRKEGLLTRDSREVERKKYFFRKARKRPQYSKR